MIGNQKGELTLRKLANSDRQTGGISSWVASAGKDNADSVFIFDLELNAVEASLDASLQWIKNATIRLVSFFLCPARHDQVYAP